MSENWNLHNDPDFYVEIQQPISGSITSVQPPDIAKLSLG
jgi:hypothetical protein